jgi:translocation protein SEC66
MLRTRLNEIQEKTQSENEWWQKRRTSIQTDLMKELDTIAPVHGAKPAVSTTKSTSDEDAVLVENPNAGETGSMRKKKGKK